MSRQVCRGMLAAALALGALRLIDLIVFTDATGFCTFGSAWARYAVAAVYWAALFLWPGRAPAQHPVPVPVPGRRFMLPLAALAILAAVASAWESVSGLLYPATALARDPAMRALELLWFTLRLVAGAGWIVFAAWCAALYAGRRPLTDSEGAARRLGYAAWLPFAARALLAYGDSHPSPHRMLYIIPVFAFVSAMLLSVKMLGLQCVPQDAGVRRGAAAGGALCFFLCTCVYLPQSIVTMARGMTGWEQLVWQALPLGMFGVVGAALSLSLTQGEKE